MDAIPSSRSGDDRAVKTSPPNAREKEATKVLTISLTWDWGRVQATLKRAAAEPDSARKLR